MSHTVRMLPNGDFELVEHSAEEFVSRDRMDVASMDKVAAPCSHFNTWQWYEGLIERYWFCTCCDHKDTERPAPPRKR